MSDILHAMATSAAVLFPVVVLIIIVGRAAVLRGEAAAHGEPQHDLEVHGAITDATPVAATVQKAGKPAVAKAQEISVLEILGFGTALFVLAVVLLFGISVWQHMS